MRVFALFLGLCAGWSAPAAEPASSPLELDLEEHVRVSRVVWPVFVEPAKRAAPGSCDALQAATVVVTEDGVPARVTALERQRKPTIHAILIDTSGSMFGPRLDQAKLAATRYARQLRADESAMLITFDNHMMLQFPLTRLDVPGAREELLDAIDAIELGGWTQMRDALFQTMRLLNAYPNRKVVLLLTDGFDTMSRQPPGVVRGVAATAPHQNLTIFPIGLQLPRSQRPDPRPGSVPRSIVQTQPLMPQWNPRPFLMDLADNTGGEFFEVAEPGQLSDVFQEIRDRLNRELYLHYEAPPFGAGARDPADADYTFRKVKVRAKDRTCRIRNPKFERYVAREVERAPDPEVEARRTDAGTFPLPSRVAMPFPAGWAAEASGGSFLLLERGRIVGRTADLVQEWGDLWGVPAAAEGEADAASAAGRRTGDPGDREYDAALSAHCALPGMRRVPLDEARFASRMFLMDLPPLEHTLRRPASRPEDVLYYWLLNGIHPSMPPGFEYDDRVRNVLHGRTFLEIRPYLALAIFDHYPDFRAWTLRRLREDLTRELTEGLADVGTDVIEELLAARLAQPTPEELQRYLAAWLGDVRADDLVAALERRMINELLRAAPAARAQVETVARRIEQGWPALRYWFRPPEDVRVIVPMLLFYDERRDLTGFVRIVMPRIQPDGRSVDALPQQPLALQIVQRLLAKPALGRELRGRWRVERVRYADLPGDRLFPEEKRGERREQAWPAIRLTFGRTVDGAAGGSVLTLVLEPGKSQALPLLCVGGGGALADGIREQTQAPPCALDEREIGELMAER